MSRAQLLNAAEEVFGRKGFHDTTLKEVAELAEFSVASVYSFFQSKDDLFGEIFRRRVDELMPKMRELCTPEGEPLEQLHGLVEFHVRWLRKHPHFGRLYLRHASPTMVAMAGADPSFEEAMALQADVFRRGQAAGLLRDGDPEVLAHLFSGILSAYQSVDPAVVSDAAGPAERLPLDALHRVVDAAFRREG